MSNHQPRLGHLQIFHGICLIRKAVLALTSIRDVSKECLNLVLLPDHLLKPNLSKLQNYRFVQITTVISINM